MSRDHALVVDADGHVLEPPDLWHRYLEPELRERAIRIVVDDDGLEVLLVDGRPVDKVRGTLGGLGGVGMDPALLKTPGVTTYVEGWARGSNDPRERLEVLGEEGIDIALLYPTIGLFWEGYTNDPELATAYTRAYNRWIVEFCATNPARLGAIAHVSLLDPAGVCDEAERARADGCIGVMLAPDPMARGGRGLYHEDLARFWSTLQDLDMPFAFHVVVREPGDHMLREWMGPRADATDPAARPHSRPGPNDGLFGHTLIAIDVITAFTQMLSSGVFERYPRLRCAVLESGATWMAAWLDRMDAKYETQRASSPLTMLPSEYFYRQCVVSADPEETMTAELVRHLGADYFIWASDYPHIDSSLGVLKELEHHLAVLPEEDQDKVLGRNALRFYDLTA